MNSIQAVVFDMDGVLMDSTACHRAAFEEVLRPLGITNFHYPRFAGQRTPDVMRIVLKENHLDASEEKVRALATEKSRLALQKITPLCPVTEGCVPVLQTLASSFPLALASSGSKATVHKFLSMTRLGCMFRSVLTGHDVVNSKPDPEIYRRSFESLNVAAANCAVVEDAVAGVRSAKAAGGYVIGFTGLNNTTCADQLLDAGADLTVDSLEGLLPLLVAKPAPLRKEDWSVIIPAAGRGSRLGFDKPKILFPVAGRTILEWLLDLFVPRCETMVFVLSPDGQEHVRKELERLIPGRYEIAIQHVPTGMGDAVSIGLQHVKTKHTAVAWGDQVALRERNVDAAMRLHEGPLQPEVTVPTVLRENPYIHFPRDEQGNICGLLQHREGDAMPEIGESDTGFFCFNARSLERLLESLRQDAQQMGRATNEFNLLPAIPLAARQAGSVITPQLMTLEETIGINSAADAIIVEDFLRRSR